MNKEIKDTRLIMSMTYGIGGGILAFLIMLSEYGNMPTSLFLIPIPLGAWIGWCLR